MSEIEVLTAAAVAASAVAGLALGWTIRALAERVAVRRMWEMRARCKRLEVDNARLRIVARIVEGPPTYKIEPEVSDGGLVAFPSLWRGGPPLQVVGDDTGRYEGLRKRALWAMKPKGGGTPGGAA